MVGAEMQALDLALSDRPGDAQTLDELLLGPRDFQVAVAQEILEFLRLHRGIVCVVLLSEGV